MEGEEVHFPRRQRFGMPEQLAQGNDEQDGIHPEVRDHDEESEADRLVETLQEDGTEDGQEDEGHRHRVSERARRVRILDDVGGGVGGGECDRDDEVGQGEAEEHEHESLALPPGKKLLQHGDAALAVGTVGGHLRVDRQGDQQRHGDEDERCHRREHTRGEERDADIPHPTGKTFARYASLRPDGVRGPDDLPLFKPPYSHIVAIDMNTGEHLWRIPIGDTPDLVLNHPKLKGIKIPDTGTGANAPMVVTATLLIYASAASDGTPMLFAIDKKTGERVGAAELPESAHYGMMTYVHKGKQYVIAQTGRTLTAMALAE